MFIEVQLYQEPIITINYHNIIKITKDINSFAVLKMIDGSEIKTTNKYDNLLKLLRREELLK